MMKCVYAHTGFSSQYPSYLQMKATGDETCGLDVSVRDHAHVEHTENGSHFAPGHSSETHLSKEHAMDLARAIFKHYQADAPNPFHYPVPKAGEEGIGHEARTRFFPEDHLPGETSRVYEETERVGEISQTRRLIIESVGSPSLTEQTAKLAIFIMTNFEGEPSGELNEGAIDVAIRLLGDYAAIQHARKMIEDSKGQDSIDKIALGLRSGQGDHDILGETEHTTRSGSFVDAGTKAVSVPYEELVRLEEAALPSGANTPAAVSAPLGVIGREPNPLYDEISYEPCALGHPDQDPAPIIIPPADVEAEDDDRIPF